MAKTKVSIVIVHYNSDQVTKECLRSLAKLNQSNLDVSVILVDNGSTNPFSFGPKHFLFKLIRVEKNTGFTGGNNIGVRYALDNFHPDYILLLNSDTIIHPDFLKLLVKKAKSSEMVGSVSPKIYFQKGYEFHNGYLESEKGKVIWFAGGSIDWKNVYGFHRGVDEVDQGQFNLPSKKRSSDEIPYYAYETMDFASGCCVLFPAEVLKSVGIFDDSYFLYWEDADLSIRIRNAGYHLYFEPQSIVWHKNAGSSGGSGSSIQKRFQRRNRLKFALKYAPVRSKIAVFKEFLFNRS